MRTTAAADGCSAAVLLGISCWASPAPPRRGPRASAGPARVKVMVINLFGLEAAPWIKALHRRRNPRAGPVERFSAGKCNAASICQMTTGMGHANAAASMMAVLLSGRSICAKLIC